jgi:putative membrane protein
MFNTGADSVSKIHRRWSLTRLNPSSYKISYITSLLSATILIIIYHIYYTKIDQINLAISLVLGITALTSANFLDFFALHGTPINKMSKVLHVSAFSNLLWVSTVLLGIASDALFSKTGSSVNYIIEGMLLAVGLRIGILTSVFGASLLRAIPTSFIQPLIFLLAIVNPSAFYHDALTYPIGFGFTLVMLAIIWSIIADRAGRPVIRSTFRVLQAFLAAWTDNKADKMEAIAESKAQNRVIATFIIKFKRLNRKEISIILPDVHPGPFNPIGGSNLPYVLYELFSKNALIMHSVSDHSLNIPSKIEVERYVQTLSKAKVLEKNNVCTIPVQINVDKSMVTGIAFGSTAVVILSLAPTGMEDVPEKIRIDLDQYSSHLGFQHILVIDSHNAIGDYLKKNDSDNLVLAGKLCLEKLKNLQQHEFKIGFSNSEEILYNTNSMQDLGQSGLAALIIEVDGNQYAIGWADANNMEKGIRDHVITKLNNNGIQMIEVCTSDTHSTSGKRTRQGYYTLGNRSSPDKVAEMYFQISKKSIENADMSTFELLSTESSIRVMGKNQFDDYSFALDKSMNITKIFLVFTFTLFVIMLVVTQ